MNIQEVVDSISAHIEVLSDRDGEIQADAGAALMAIAYLVVQLHAARQLDGNLYVAVLRKRLSLGPATPALVQLGRLADGIEELLSADGA